MKSKMDKLEFVDFEPVTSGRTNGTKDRLEQLKLRPGVWAIWRTFEEPYNKTSLYAVRARLKALGADVINNGPTVYARWPK